MAVRNHWFAERQSAETSGSVQGCEESPHVVPSARLAKVDNRQEVDGGANHRYKVDQSRRRPLDEAVSAIHNRRSFAMNLLVDQQQAELIRWITSPLMSLRVPHLSRMQSLVVESSPCHDFRADSAAKDREADGIRFDQQEIVDPIAKLRVQIEEAETCLADDFEKDFTLSWASSDFGLWMIVSSTPITFARFYAPISRHMESWCSESP